MHIFKISIFLSLFSVLAFAKSGTIKIQGEVSNPTAKSISIDDLNNGKVIDMDLNDAGVFKGSARIDSGYFMLKYGRNTFYIYLHPKDNLQITFDAEHMAETIALDGKGSIRNNYLIAKRALNKSEFQDIERFYQTNEDDYLDNVNNLRDKQLELLSDYKVASYFKRDEMQSIEYGRLMNIKRFESNLDFYLGEKVTASEDLLKPIYKIDYDNEPHYSKFLDFKYLSNSYYSDLIENGENVDGMLAQLQKVPHQSLLINLVNGFYYKISSKNERAEDYLKLIKRVVNDQPFVEAAQNRYDNIKDAAKLSKGQQSPNFSYESISGEMISLADFKGKWVYIDVWATWCAPCVQQIPYLKKLEERYHDEAIVFVSISVDKKRAKKAWKQMISDKDLDGIQLFADNSFDSAFMEAYAVNSIPRFIILDPDGNVYNPEAPRPSFPKTQETLDGLLR